MIYCIKNLSLTIRMERLHWGAKKDREKLFNYLYRDASIFLSRKHDKIKDKL